MKSMVLWIETMFFGVETIQVIGFRTMSVMNSIYPSTKHENMGNKFPEPLFVFRNKVIRQGHNIQESVTLLSNHSREEAKNVIIFFHMRLEFLGTTAHHDSISGTLEHFSQLCI